MPLKFPCPECGKPIVTFLQVGERTPCRHCGREVFVSGSAEQADETPDWAPPSRPAPPSTHPGGAGAEGEPVPVVDAMVVAKPAAPAAAEEAPAAPTVAYADMDPSTITEDEARAFVGPNARYYLEKWVHALDGRGRATGFNGAAFILAGLWVPYRKMYQIAIILYALSAGTAAIEHLVMPSQGDPMGGWVTWLAAVVLWFVCGTYGNRWYLARARRIIGQVRAEGLPNDEHLEALAKRGGTSVLAAIGMFAFLYVLVIGAIASVELMRGGLGELAGPGTSRLTFNAGEIYYNDTVTEQQVRRLGQYLVQTQFFDATPKTVVLGKTAEAFEFRMVILRGLDRDQEFLEAVKQFGAELSRDVFDGARVDMDLCDEYLNSVKVIRGSGPAPPALPSALPGP